LEIIYTHRKMGYYPASLGVSVMRMPVSTGADLPQSMEFEPIFALPTRMALAGGYTGETDSKGF